MLDPKEYGKSLGIAVSALLVIERMSGKLTPENFGTFARELARAAVSEIESSSPESKYVVEIVGPVEKRF